MKKNKLIIGLSSLLVVSLILTGCGKAKLKNGEEIAVKVKGGNVTADQYYNEIKGNNINTLINMIDHKLLDKSYKKSNDEDESVKKQIDQIKSYYGSDEATYKNVLQQYFGVSSEDELDSMLRLEYKRNQAVKDYIRKNLSKQEIKNYYNNKITGEINASHILITVDVDDNATDEEKEEADKKALKKANKVIKELESGKKFEDLAKKYSDDEATKEKGGDLGYFQPSDMVEEFANAVKNLKKGKYTNEPVKTKYGYHIILKKDEKEKEKLDKIKNDIKEKLTDQKLSEDPTLYYQTLIDYRESKNITWNDSKLKKQYKKYMETLIENAKKSTETK